MRLSAEERGVRDGVCTVQGGQKGKEERCK